jgi:hypothetical protein
LVPVDHELDELIRATRKRLQVGSDAPPSRTDTVMEAIQRLPSGPLIAGTLGLVLLALGFGLGLRRFTSRYSVLTAILAGVGLFLLIVRLQWSPPPLGVLLSEQVALRPEPNTNVQAALRMERGSTLWVRAASDRWVQVVLPSGTFWVEKDQIGLVAQEQP